MADNRSKKHQAGCNVRINEDSYRKLKEIAEPMGARKITKLVNQILEEYLEENAPKRSLSLAPHTLGE